MAASGRANKTRNSSTVPTICLDSLLKALKRERKGASGYELDNPLHMFTRFFWSYYTPPSLNVLHLVSALEKKGLWGENTGEDATMLSFGEQRFLVCHMNRLWSVSKDPQDPGDDTSDGHNKYPNAWPWAGSKHEIEFFPDGDCFLHEGKCVTVVKDTRCARFQVIYDSDVVAVQFARYGMRRAFAGYLSIDITDKLILLQRCVRKYNACRRRARSWLGQVALEGASPTVLLVPRRHKEGR